MEDEQTMDYQTADTKTMMGDSSPALDAVIDALDVSPRKKELFHLINKYDLMEFKGMINISKAKKVGISFKDRFAMCPSLLAFFFSFLYYFVTGMWRKGLFILGITVAIAAVFVFFDFDSLFLGLLPQCLAALTAFGDQYRTKVLKETFWF